MLINPGHPDYEALWADTLAAGGEADLEARFGATDVEDVLRLLQETLQRTLAQGIGIVDEEDIGDDEDEGEDE